MTYAKRFGKYEIRGDGFLLQWFKNFENAEKKWNEIYARYADEWLEEYDEVALVDSVSGRIIHSFSI